MIVQHQTPYAATLERKRMHKVTFFTKPECTLCDAAFYVLERVRQHIPFELDKVDIGATGQEKWFAAYRHDIPVVHLDGVEVFRHHVNERSLRELLLKP